MEQALQDWIDANQPGDQMYWKPSAVGQFERFKRLAASITGICRVVGTHISKSIALPVVEISTVRGYFLLRDNFHDVNLYICWDEEPPITLDDAYPCLDWDWYLNEIDRKRGYCYKGWSDEEMEDPRILRVQVTYDNGNTVWREVKGEEKDRWMARMTDPTWYGKDWSSGELIPDGPIGPGCKFYCASYPYAEGIRDVLYERDIYDKGVWKPGSKQGFIVTNMDRAFMLMRKIAGPRTRLEMLDEG